MLRPASVARQRPDRASPRGQVWLTPRRGYEHGCSYGTRWFAKHGRIACFTLPESRNRLRGARYFWVMSPSWLTMAPAPIMGFSLPWAAHHSLSTPQPLPRSGRTSTGCARCRGCQSCRFDQGCSPTVRILPPMFRLYPVTHRIGEQSVCKRCARDSCCRLRDTNQ